MIKNLNISYEKLYKMKHWKITHSIVWAPLFGIAVNIYFPTGELEGSIVISTVAVLITLIYGIVVNSFTKRNKSQVIFIIIGIILSILTLVFNSQIRDILL